jgi:hypothetical protein
MVTMKWWPCATNLIIGHAAYDTARRLYPNDCVDYREGARIIGRSDQSPPAGD